MIRILLSSSLLGFIVGSILTTYSILNSTGPVEAAVEQWPAHSWIQHTAGQRQNIKPLGVLAGTGWITHYNNAVGSWNANIGDDPFIFAGPNDYGHVHVLESSSADEAYLDWLLQTYYGFALVYSCAQADAAYPGKDIWGSVAPYNHWSYWDTPSNPAYRSGHYHSYKVCIWPTRIPNYNNPQGWHYRWLTITHELGHVLSLGDDVDGLDNCLMKDGFSMQLLCLTELNAVKGHYNRW